MSLCIYVENTKKDYDLSQDNSIRVKENDRVRFYFESQDKVSAKLIFNDIVFSNFLEIKKEGFFKYTLHPNKDDNFGLFNNYLGRAPIKFVIDDSEIIDYEVEVISDKLTTENCAYMLDYVVDDEINIFDVLGKGVTQYEVSASKYQSKQKLLNEIISVVKDAIPKLLIAPITKLVKTEKVLSYKHSNAFVDEGTFSWLCSNLSELEEVSNNGQIQIDLEEYRYKNLQYAINADTYITVENIFVFKFLYDLIGYLSKHDIYDEEVSYSNSQGEYKSLYDVIKTKTKIKSFACEIRPLRQFLSQLLSKTNIQTKHLKYFRAEVTPNVLNNISYKRVYQQAYNFYNQIVYRSEYSDVNYLDFIKNIPEIFEYYCVISIIKYFKNKGVGNVVTNKRSKKYSFFYSDEVEVNLYYEPRISRPKDKSQYNYFKVDYENGNEYKPDIVLEINTLYEQYLIIADAKYSRLDTVEKYYLKPSIMKYIHGIASREGKSIVKSLMLIYPENSEKESVYKSYYEGDYSLDGQNTIIPMIGTHSLGFYEQSEVDFGKTIDKMIEKVISNGS
ncbi:hypothetical protein [Francisella tularensis]|uniref:hypothetical protein n=1 Tax=Francisella tularensis TaxID=263 RepID=UPI0008F54C72|nr:hypothetical protein [Francisella tularensis]APA82299.1 hypothetical protein N894_0315 [Francisella tularensis subsp. novicida PA10-7858]